MSQLKYWVWLSMRFGVRPKVKLALVEHFGTPRDVYFATEADYRIRASLRPEELRLLLDKDLHEAERALAICDREHIRALTIQDAAYPQRLLQIYDPPLVLYVRGTLPPLDDRAAVAVVGTRSATPYGMRTAHKLGSEIVRHGGIVLSVSPPASTAQQPRVRWTRAVSAWVCPARRSIWILRARARRVSRAAARS